MKRQWVWGWVAMLCLGGHPAAYADNWPAWRGPSGTGISTEKALPIAWEKNKNIRWRVELPAPGNASPIIWGDRVFVAQAVPTENRRTLMCFDRTDGKLLWQSGVSFTGQEPTHKTNPYCAGTPATDGKLIYVCFGTPGVYAYDFEGNEVWHRDLGNLTHMFGSAVSPILYDDLCILNFGPTEGTKLIALDKATGKTIWEKTPPVLDPSETAPARAPGGGAGGPGGRRGGRGGGGASWSTPLLVQTHDHDELIVTFPGRLAAYDPKTGKELWTSKGIGTTIYTTPVWGEGVLVASSSGLGEKNLVAVRPGGSGDVTESHRAWQIQGIGSQMGSGVVHEGHLYSVTQDGIASCIEIQNGQEIWQKRLRGAGAQGGCWSSMILVDGNIYLPNQSGDVFVFKASPTFEILSTNSLEESTNATLAVSSGELFQRTDSALWCVAESK